jgi:hypothetical protein
MVRSSAQSASRSPTAPADAYYVDAGRRGVRLPLQVRASFLPPLGAALYSCHEERLKERERQRADRLTRRRLLLFPLPPSLFCI